MVSIKQKNVEKGEPRCEICGTLVCEMPKNEQELYLENERYVCKKCHKPILSERNTIKSGGESKLFNL